MYLCRLDGRYCGYIPFAEFLPLHASFPLIQFARLTTTFPRSLTVSISYHQMQTMRLTVKLYGILHWVPWKQILGQRFVYRKFIRDCVKNHIWKEKKAAAQQSLEKLNCSVVVKKLWPTPTGCSVLGRLSRGVPSRGRWDQYTVPCIYELLDVGYSQGQARTWAKIDRLASSQLPW